MSSHYLQADFALSVDYSEHFAKSTYPANLLDSHIGPQQPFPGMASSAQLVDNFVHASGGLGGVVSLLGYVMLFLTSRSLR